MNADQCLSEIVNLAAEAQDAYERGEAEECLGSLDLLLMTIEKVMPILEEARP